MSAEHNADMSEWQMSTTQLHGKQSSSLSQKETQNNTSLWIDLDHWHMFPTQKNHMLIHVHGQDFKRSKSKSN